ncbi:transforming acidic coiled-coil-containing protein 1 [Elysia marginata]|uniref:Transforming acidic coiled-coil-containing protein 1 n=1 Tax=Elysia marginata TaxID=1093978 RepID=A0AAV4IJP7_9GAST|nr:transforming acidic coiled-coil-containing protein 1 [Elysia marginata]
MADGEDGSMPGSPPLPARGTYNIDFDALDESSNPFESKIQLGSSPPIRSSANYNFDADALDDIDPFKPRSAVANSPVGSPKSTNSYLNNNNNYPVAFDESATIPASDVAPGTGEKPGDADANTKASPKKKKLLKKVKVQSKIKPPKNIKPPEGLSDDIQIFMPGEAKKPTTDLKDNSLLDIQQQDQALAKDITVIDDASEKKTRPSSMEEDVPHDPAPEAMVSSSEMDTHFVNTDDLDDLSLNTNKVFTKPKEIKNNKENLNHTTTEKIDVDPSLPIDLTISEKGTKPTVPQQGVPGQHPSDDGSPAMKRSPRRQAGEESNKEKHPAARALEVAAYPEQDTRLKPTDAKNESSSEENTFYDAEEYPSPLSAASAKLGQKNSSSAMQSGQPDECGPGKGTMVQVVQVLRYSQTDWNKLKQELELSFQATLLNKEREWSALLGERDKRLEQAQETNRKLKQTNDDMRTVVAEFEKTISQLQAEKERHKLDLNKTTAELENDRDQAIEDLQSVESAFSDLHRRYEKSKGIIEGFKKNEEQLKRHVEELQAKLKKSETKMQSLRSQAEEKLDRANEDIEQIKRSTKSDVARLEAALKKSEIRICTLEESLHRKEKENEELTAICDELIAKVGS